jgi:type III pantothenate kinase
MLLAIDIGNTQIAAGLFKGQKLIAHWRLSSTRERTEDETWILMQSICLAHGYELQEAKGVAISSVVPDMTQTFEKMATKYLSTEPLNVRHDLDLGIKILYDNPANVGADRLCNAVGGFKKYGGPLIIVDLGTATTFDVISRKAEYLGGVIAPGIETSAMVLHQRAAKLPRVELRFPDKVIGRSTESSMQSGLMFGAVEMIDGFVRRINEELGEKATTIATGGLARLILNRLASVDAIESFLTLEGLLIIYEKIKKKRA